MIFPIKSLPFDFQTIMETSFCVAFSWKGKLNTEKVEFGTKLRKALMNYAINPKISNEYVKHKTNISVNRRIKFYFYYIIMFPSNLENATQVF